MKHVLQAVWISKSWILLSAQIVLSIGFLYLHAISLKLIGIAADTGTMAAVNNVIICLVASSIMSALMQLTAMHRHYAFTAMNNMVNDKILDGDVSMFLDMSPGKITSIEGSIWQLSNMLRIYINLIQYVIQLIINIWAIYTISSSQILPIVIVTTILCIVLYFINKAWNNIDSQCHELKKSRGIEQDECINGFVEVRSFQGTKEAHRKSIHNANRKMLKLLMKRHIISSIMTLVQWCGSNVLVVLALMYGIAALKEGIFTSAVTVTMIVYIWRLEGPICGLSYGLSDLAEASVGLKDFAALMEYESKIKDGTVELDDFTKDITLKGVNFSYDKLSNALVNINMTIYKGEHIGICGISGGGKTTLLKLLQRFYDPDEGSILIDGVDLRRFTLSSLRKHIGVVHQDTFIFDGSFRDNVAYALKPNDVPEEKIIEACKKAGLWDFIQSQKDGLDTKVGNRGLKLSGGQMQRVSLARMFLVDPKIIILDEATSALDNETERVVQQALDMFHDKTIIAVAHRLTTIEKSDRIYVLSGHSIAEFGTHEELMALKGEYANMHK